MAKNDEIKGAEKTTEAVRRESGKLPFFKRIAKWFRDMKSELKKVVWPTRKQIINNTLVALVVMVVAAIVLWGFDSIATAIVNTIISVLG